MSYALPLYIAATVWSLALAFAGWLRLPSFPARWTFGVGMLLFAVEGLAAYLSLSPSTTVGWGTWLGLRFLVYSALPGVWLLFSLSYARGNHAEFIAKWRPVLLLSALPPILVLIGYAEIERAAVSLQPHPFGALQVRGWTAPAVDVLFIGFAALILVNFERTLRASVGTMRWRVKYALLGVSLLFAARIYMTTQNLLYYTTDVSIHVFGSAAMLVACLAVSVAFFRGGLFSVEIYPSPTLVQRSFAVLLVGGYLLLVGVAAKLLSVIGSTTSFPEQSFLILLALMVSAALLTSDRVRLAARRFASRHLRQPTHDFRAIWHDFNTRTATHLNETDLCRAVVHLVSETMQALSVTIWLADEGGKTLLFGSSTSILPDSVDDLLTTDTSVSTMVETMKRHPEPVDVDASDAPWMADLRRLNPHLFASGGPRTAVPLLAKGEWLGLLVVGDRVAGVRNSLEDLELLKSIADQTATALLNLRLSRRLVEMGEMEAFQTMAAFFVHDLKNTAASLSLMLQNLPAQFNNPAFQQDALKSVSKSVTRLNELIGRLGLLRQNLEIKPAPDDLNRIVEATLGTIGPLKEIRLARDAAKIPPALVDAEQMQKVLTNLILNARDAVPAGGSIEVSTGAVPGWVHFSVRDNGCGMKPEFVRKSLFRPFQTTKKGGVGIGMFHCKMIVEAHHGHIEVQSEEGQGTTFRVLLPQAQGVS